MLAALLLLVLTRATLQEWITLSGRQEVHTITTMDSGGGSTLVLPGDYGFCVDSSSNDDEVMALIWVISI